MNTVKLTAKDFKQLDSYYKEYVGKEDLSNFEGNLEIEGNLSYVKFERLSVTGYIIAEAGTGIKAGTGIEAGWGIKAGTGIEAGTGIKAGEGIEAGWGIKAGTGIEAGEGIVSGLYITCKLSLKFSRNIFAGVCWWRKIQDFEKKITCGKLEGGTVCYGIVEELGLPEKTDTVNSEQKVEEITLNGKKYRLVE